LTLSLDNHGQVDLLSLIESGDHLDSPGETTGIPERSPDPDPVPPIVKWAGGKAAAAADIEGFMPSSYGCYFEPFAGGLAMLLHLCPDRAIVSDTNEDLICLYQEVKRDPRRVSRLLHILADHHRGPGSYLAVRKSWNKLRNRWSPAVRAASFMYLNRTCFNGLWRVNRAGGMNVPPGSGSIYWPSEDHLISAAAVLSRADIRCSDYRDTVGSAQPGDLVYFDPPYLRLPDPGEPGVNDPDESDESGGMAAKDAGTGTGKAKKPKTTRAASFTAYTKDAFGPDQHAELASLARELSGRGIHVVLSSSDTPEAREIYAGFRLHETSPRRRSVSAKASGRARVGELILIGGAS